MAHHHEDLEQVLWNKAQKEDNIVGYLEYKEFLPHGARIDQINASVDKLKKQYMITAVVVMAIVCFILFR